MPEPAALVRKLDVLVVEDNDADAREVIEGLPARMPELALNFRRARSHAELSGVLAKYAPDVIVVNLALPGATGVRLVEEIQCRLPHVTIIGVTAGRESGTGVEAIRGGVQDFLVKRADYLDALGRSILFSFERTQKLNYSEQDILRDRSTGLFNRLAFIERLRYSVVSARRRRERFCIASFMFHDFPLIAEVFGYSACERVLHEIGDRFREHIRESDVVARFRENHFVAIFENIRETTRPAIVDRMHEYLTRPVTVDLPVGGKRTELRVSATVGLSLYPEHVDNINVDEDANKLLFAADVALNSSTPGSVDNCILFDPILFEHEIVGGRMH